MSHIFERRCLSRQGWWQTIANARKHVEPLELSDMACENEKFVKQFGVSYKVKHILII